MPTTISGTIYCLPLTMDDTMSAINADIQAQGVTIDSFGSGKTNPDSSAPQDMKAHWVVDGDGDLQAIVQTAAANHSSFFGSWKDWSKAITSDVVLPSLEQLGNDVSDVGKTIEFNLPFAIIAVIVIGVGVVLFQLRGFRK